MPTDYIKAADLHAALARVRDETKAKVWAEAYAAGRKDEADQYAKAIQLVTLGRALTGGPAVVTQPLGNSSGTVREQFLTAPTTVADPVAEAARNVKAFAENPALPRRENPDGPAYGKLLQLPEGWVHPDGAVTPLTHAGEAHVAALAEADPGVSQAFHASLARHAHREHPGEFVDDDVKDYAFDKGFIHLTGRGRTIEATGKHEMLLKHRKFLKELAMRATTLVFRPVDGDDYEVKAKADRTNKAIPANPLHRTEAVIGTHHVIQDALSRGDTDYANQIRGVHADALDDAGAVREAALERVLAGQQPASHLAATFKNAANLKRAARSRTEAAHTATETAYEGSLNHGLGDADDEDFATYAHRSFDHSHDARGWSRLGEHSFSKDAGEMAALRHTRAANEHDSLADFHADEDEEGNKAIIDHHTATAALHRHAAEQHRVAAAYNAAAHHADTQRTVKAIRTNWDKMEQHEGPHEPQVGDYDEDDTDPTNPVHAQFYRSEKLFHESERAGHLHTLQRQYPDLDPHAINENMLDAADIGDEPGHRYWKRRLGGVHLMLAGEAHAAGDKDLAAEHDKFAAHLHGHGFANILDDEHETAAHLIAHHKGDVAAAARHASEVAIGATDPEHLKNAQRGGNLESINFNTDKTSGPEYHIGAMYKHIDAAHAVKNAPDTYRPLTLGDIHAYDAGQHTSGFYTAPDEHGRRTVVSVHSPTQWHAGNEFRLPAMAGYDPHTITHENYDQYHTIDTDTRQHRSDVQQMHEVAALLHREAATGDHEKREIKADPTGTPPVTTPWSQSPAELVKSGVKFFRTGQGSTYALHPSGPTIRIKTPHEGHVSTDHGIKQGSERTVYVAEGDARRIGMWGSASSTSKRLSLANADEHGGHLLLTSIGTSGSRGKDGEPIKFHSKPALGLSPLELFNPRTESIGPSDAQHYSSSHPGSPITQLDVPHVEGHEILTAAARAAGKKNVYTPKPPTVKAFAPGIEAEPGATGRTLHPTVEHVAHLNDGWSDEGALHAAMLSRPHDMTPRMVLADYYDDHDQPHTAALHRFVAQPTRESFDRLAAFHEHPSEVAETVQRAAAEHVADVMPRYADVATRQNAATATHPAFGAVPPGYLRDLLTTEIHNRLGDSDRRLNGPEHSERYVSRYRLATTHRLGQGDHTTYSAAHADPSTVADWGPDHISEQGHAFARTLHHAASEAHRFAREYLTEQDAIDKPATNDGPIPEGVWRHPRLGREGKAIADPAPHGYCPDCKGVNSDAKTCPTCGPFDKSPKYSYAGVELKGEMADYLRSAGAMIRDADLATDGRETDPHVTVRYGLHENDGDGTHTTLTGVGPVSVRFASKLAVFSNEDADVIHAPVLSEDLHRLNGMLAALPHTDTHAVYKPHATIAYVKPGLGAKYITELPAPPTTSQTIGTVTFSNPAKKTRVINLEAE